MGVFSFIVLSVVCQMTTSAEKPLTTLLDKVTQESVPTTIGSSLSSSVRKERDSNCEFSSPLILTSISKPLPKISQPDSSDLILDVAKILPVSKSVSAFDSITSTPLLPSVPEIESSLLLSSPEPVTFPSSECLNNIPNICKCTVYSGFSEPDTYLSSFPNDFVPVSSSPNVPTSNLMFKESFMTVSKSKPSNTHISLSNYPRDDVIPSSVTATSPSITELLTQSEGPKFNSFDLMSPTEIYPSMYPFNFDSTSLPDMVSPNEMSLVSNYPDFLSSVLPYSKTSDSSDQFLFDTNSLPISSRSIPYITPESTLFNDYQISASNSPSQSIMSSNSPLEPSVIDIKANNASPLLNSMTTSPFNSFLDIEPVIQSTETLIPIKPSLLEQFSTISTIRPRVFLPINVPYECPAPIPIECFETVTPPKVPISIINTNLIIGEIDPNLAETKISPRTNPREYIKSICSAINTEPIALSDANIVPSKVEIADFGEFVTPVAPNIICPTSSVSQKTLILPEFSEPIHVLPTNPYANTDSWNNIYSIPDQTMLSSPPCATPIDDIYTCYTPTFASIDLPTTNTLTLSELLPLIQSVTSAGSTTTSTRPLNITPNDIQRVSNVIGSNVDTPIVFLSFPEQTSFQLPSIIGSDIYCSKDSVLLQTPSPPTVSCVNITPPPPTGAIVAATSEVVSSINNAASKIAKNTISSVSSYLKSIGKNKTKSRSGLSVNSYSVPTSRASNLSSTNSITPNTVTFNMKSDSSKISNQPYFLTVSSSVSPLQSTPAPVSSFNTFSSPSVSPTCLPSYTPISSPEVSPVTTNNPNDLEKLLDIVLVTELLKNDNCLDQGAVETILSLLYS